MLEPDGEALLGAVVEFLETDLREGVADKGLAFRVRIAANLIRMVAAAGSREEGWLARELARYRRLLKREAADDPGTTAAGRALLATYEGVLARELRTGDWQPAELAAVGKTLREALGERLAVLNPRFALDLEIE